MQLIGCFIVKYFLSGHSNMYQATLSEILSKIHTVQLDSLGEMYHHLSKDE